MQLTDIINHIRNRDYMSGVDRDHNRVKATGEVFTPTPLVEEILNQFPQELFKDISKTFLDNSCGDGQFLGEILIRKLEKLVDENNAVTNEQFEKALSTVYGVDLMIDNVDECRKRLLCGRNDLHDIVEQNIYQADGLKFSYDFCPMSKTRHAREERLRRAAENEKRKVKFQTHVDTLFKSKNKPKVST